MFFTLEPRFHCWHETQQNQTHRVMAPYAFRKKSFSSSLCFPQVAISAPKKIENATLNDSCGVEVSFFVVVPGGIDIQVPLCTYVQVVL